MNHYLALFLVLFAGGLLTTDAQDSEQAAKKKQKATSGELYEKIAALPKSHDFPASLGRRRYFRDFAGRAGGRARYIKEVDGSEILKLTPF